MRAFVFAIRQCNIILTPLLFHVPVIVQLYFSFAHISLTSYRQRGCQKYKLFYKLNQVCLNLFIIYLHNK